MPSWGSQLQAALLLRLVGAVNSSSQVVRGCRGWQVVLGAFQGVTGKLLGSTGAIVNSTSTSYAPDTWSAAAGDDGGVGGPIGSGVNAEARGGFVASLGSL